MTTTVLGIYNAAISAARGKGRLATLTDNTRERTECDIWYDQVRTQVLEAAYWPSARKLERLTTTLDTRDFTVDWVNSDPEPQFTYAYQLPTDYLRAWHLVNYEQFILSWRTDKVVLHSNIEEPVLVYAFDQTDPAKWTPGLRMAVVYALAAAISGPLKGENSLVQINYQLANEQILAARANVAGLLSDQKEVIPPALSARGYTLAEETRYFYPYGDLFPGAIPNA